MQRMHCRKPKGARESTTQIQTVRFWVLWRGGWVRLALRNGQEIHLEFSEPTDEGFFYECDQYCWIDDFIYRQDFVRQRDCDGLYDHYHDSVCHILDVTKGVVIKELFDDPDVPDRAPVWRVTKRGQRDYTAEAAGY